MKRISYSWYVLLLLSTKLLSQDRIFLRNGTNINGKVIALSEDTLSYRDSLLNVPAVTIPKKDILLVEYQSGAISVFDSPASRDTVETVEQQKERKLKEWQEKESRWPNNIVSIYLPGLIIGRYTVSYERLFYNKTIGVNIPLTITYNALRALLDSNSTTTSNGTTYDIPGGLGLITGVDVNYYYYLKPTSTYYFGPRLRYGTDMILGGVEGLTVQLQNGILKSWGEKFTSTFGIGFGFFKLSEKYANMPGYEPKQVYPWGSVTWRLGLRL